VRRFPRIASATSPSEEYDKGDAGPYGLLDFKSSSADATHIVRVLTEREADANLTSKRKVKE
ncbi:hypothetical protein, partial [Pseudomonas savastanoi]|uniref:hypothetical protein n=1 Tax=Pseudomonas savastanoi TaxID=29438 RepID=UPI001C3F2862